MEWNAMGKFIKSLREGLEPQSEATMMKDTGEIVHNCAKHVEHAEWGVGDTLAEEHAEPDAAGNIAWYDIMFEHGLERAVPTNSLNILVSEAHVHAKKKMKEGMEEFAKSQAKKRAEARKAKEKMSEEVDDLDEAKTWANLGYPSAHEYHKARYAHATGKQAPAGTSTMSMSVLASKAERESGKRLHREEFYMDEYTMDGDLDEALRIKDNNLTGYKLVKDKENAYPYHAQATRKAVAMDIKDYRKKSGASNKGGAMRRTRNLERETGYVVRKEELYLEDYSLEELEDYMMTEDFDQLDETIKGKIKHFVKGVKRMAAGKPSAGAAERDADEKGRKRYADSEVHSAAARDVAVDAGYGNRRAKQVFANRISAAERLQKKGAHQFRRAERISALRDRVRNEEVYLEDYTLEEIQDFMLSEDFDQLDELSKATLGSYVNKAARSARAQAKLGAEFDSQSNRDYDRNDMESYRIRQGIKKNFETGATKRLKGIKNAVTRLTKEQVEDFMMSEDFDQLDELSKKTLHSYVKKAKADVAAKNAQTRELSKQLDDHPSVTSIPAKQTSARNVAKLKLFPNYPNDINHKANQRMSNIGVARDKINKEEFDLEEDVDQIIEYKPVTVVVNEAGKNYDAYFKAAMKAHGVKHPGELKSAEDKKRFFNKVDAGFNAKNEDVFLEAWMRSDAEERMTAHKKAGNKISDEKHVTKNGQGHHSFVVTEPSGKRTRHIFHGNTRKVETMSAAPKSKLAQETGEDDDK